MWKVAIVGSRPPKTHEQDDPITWARWRALLGRVDPYVATLPRDAVIVSGGAQGIDKEAERAAKRHGHRVQIHYPNWERGLGAGYARNRTIVHNCNALTSFWDGVSGGSRQTIEFAIEVGRPLVVYTHDGVHPITPSTLRLFPTHWANYAAHLPVVRAPVGSMCPGCDRGIGEGDEGIEMPHLTGDGRDVVRIAWHRECHESSLGRGRFYLD